LISFEGKDPAGDYGVVCKALDVRFAGPGVYPVQFLFDDNLVHEQVPTGRSKHEQ
jgi:hypothetical protein